MAQAHISTALYRVGEVGYSSPSLGKRACQAHSVLGHDVSAPANLSYFPGVILVMTLEI